MLREILVGNTLPRQSRNPTRFPEATARIHAGECGRDVLSKTRPEFTSLQKATLGRTNLFGTIEHCSMGTNA